MRNGGHVSAILLYICGSNTARAEERWFLVSQYEDGGRFQFSQISSSGGMREVWTQSTLGSNSPEPRIFRERLILECAHNRVHAVQSQTLTSQGSVLRNVNGKGSYLPIDDRPDDAWRRLFVSVCQGSPQDQPPLSPEDQDATPANVAESLAVDDPQRREAAAARILTEPGAFPPHLLLQMANVLARAGRDDEAVRWWLLSAMRAFTDVYAIYPGLEGAGEGEATVLSSFVFDVDPRISRRFHDFTVEQRSDALHRAEVDDASIPRFYPVDWLYWGSATLQVNWTLPQNAPGTDFYFRNRLQAARQEAVRHMSPLGR